MFVRSRRACLKPPVHTWRWPVVQQQCPCCWKHGCSEQKLLALMVLLQPLGMPQPAPLKTCRSAVLQCGSQATQLPNLCAVGLGTWARG